MCIYNTRFTSLSPYLEKWVKQTTSQFIFVRFSCVSNLGFCYCCYIPSLTFSGSLLQWWTVLCLFQVSQFNSRGQRNWIDRSVYVFLERRFTALIMLSFPSYNSSTIPIFHLPLCFPSPFVNTTSPIAISICLWLFFILCLSLRERR